MWSRISRYSVMIGVVTLVACGGGGSGSGTGSAAGSVSGSSSGGSSTSTSSGSQSSSSSSAHVVSTAAEASRFLAQATFGPQAAEITALTGTTLESWLDEQFAKPQTLHLDTVQAIKASAGSLVQHDFFGSWWTQAVHGDDQLRQRVAFALSQIMVVSFDLTALGTRVETIAAYYDILGRDGFGNFRTLLENVTLSPGMGKWLAMLGNAKEDASTGRTADENYAREVMQLFTIGLVKLNTDGSKVTSNGVEVATYSNDDVTGLAKALTGWGWSGPDTSDKRWKASNGVLAADMWYTPMQAYPSYHSTATKSFLGTTTAGDASTDLKAALDTLFNHPNVGPFIGKQLIQHLVTSNPSPAYVARVAAAFNNNGSGVRGDMKAVIRAVLLDNEARDVGASYSTQAGFGKVREPLLRLANWMRSFETVAPTGFYDFGGTDAYLDMSPMDAPSVFNWYRPGYVVPGSSKSGAASLVAPEMQLVNEVSVSTYMNYIDGVVKNTMGNNGNKIQAPYTVERELAVSSPEKLVDRVVLLLNADQMSAARRKLIVDAVKTITISSNAIQGPESILKRVALAVYMVITSSDYLVQK